MFPRCVRTYIETSSSLIKCLVCYAIAIAIAVVFIVVLPSLLLLLFCPVLATYRMQQQRAVYNGRERSARIELRIAANTLACFVCIAVVLLVQIDTSSSFMAGSSEPVMLERPRETFLRVI